MAADIQKTNAGQDIPDSGSITISAGDYFVLIGSEGAWTIRTIKYKDKIIAGPTGWYGTVMIPKGGRWWGTGHKEGGAEIIRSLKLSVDGKETPVVVDSHYQGERITFRKQSIIWKFKADIEITIADGHLYQHTVLEASEDCELERLYYFMHCFIKTTTAWKAELADGSIDEGKMDHKGGFSINRDTRWVAQYEPEPGLSIFCYTPEIIKGNDSQSMIWNRPQYHKYYVRHNNGQAFKKGEKLDYSIYVKVLEETGEDWAETIKTAAEFKNRYPPDFSE